MDLLKKKNNKNKNNNEKFNILNKISLKIGEKAPTVDAKLFKLSFYEIEFYSHLSFPRGDEIFCKIEVFGEPPVILRVKVLDVIFDEKRKNSFNNMIKCSILYRKGDLINILKTIKKMKEKRRKFLRFDERVKIDFIFPAHVCSTISENISKGGVYAIIDRELKKDDLILLKVKLPKVFDEVMIVGRVVHVKKEEPKEIGEKEKFGIGVEFLKIFPATKQHFERFMESLEKKKLKKEIILLDSYLI